MISPAFSTTTMSPTRISFVSMKSALCKLARLTVVPANFTGSRFDRRQRAELADLYIDADELGQSLLRREFKRDHPARRLRGRAEFFSLREIVDLNHHAVGFIRQVVPFRGPAVAIVDDCVDRIERHDIRTDGKAKAFQEVK